MATERLTIRRWQARLAEDPERAVDRFLGQLDLVTHETRRSLFAAIPSKAQLLEQVQYALADADAPLAGMPYMLQDLFDVRGMPTQCGAPFEDPFRAPLEDSSLLYQHLRRLGAAFFGKNVPAEFGVDLMGRNQTFGDCPHATGSHKVGGGGAGPTVRAVNDGWVPAAFGLDTCGGLRVPAAFHGLFSFRWGSNGYARDGVVPIVPTIDAIGWVTHSLQDIAILFDAIQGSARMDAGVSNPRGFLVQENRDTLSRDIKGGILNVTRNLDLDDDPQLNRELLQLLNQSDPTLETLQARELYSVHKYWIEEYHDAYGPELMRLIDAGRECKPGDADACDAALDNIRRSLTRFFESYDYLVLPVCPKASPLRRDWTEQLEHETRRLIAPASLATLPVLTVPFRVGPGSFGAAQLILNPKRVELVRTLIDQLSKTFATYTMED